MDAVFYEAEGGFGHLVGSAGGDVGEPDFYYAEDAGYEETAGYSYFVFTCFSAEAGFYYIEGFLVYDFLQFVLKANVSVFAKHNCTEIRV